jgi:hypothetical protein
VIYWSTLRTLDLTGARVEHFAGRLVAYPSWLVSLSVYSFWLLAPLAIAGAATARARRPPVAFWAAPLVIVICTVPLFGLARYRAPADPFVVMLVALGSVSAWRRLHGPAVRRGSA